MGRQATAPIRAARQRMRERGWTVHELWLSPTGQERLRRCQHFSESLSETIERALGALEAASTEPSIRLSNEPRREELKMTPASPSAPAPRQAAGKVADDRRAQLRRRVQAMKLEGLSAAAIARRLEAEKVPTLSGKGRWRHQAVLELLAEPAGEVAP